MDPDNQASLRPDLQAHEDNQPALVQPGTPVIMPPASAAQSIIQDSRQTAYGQAVYVSSPNGNTGISSVSQGSAKSRIPGSKRVLVGLLILVLITLLSVGVYFTMRSPKKGAQSPRASTLPTIAYNSEQVLKLAQNKQLTQAAVAKLNKVNTFYSAFRVAAQQPVVQTKWDVYDTTSQDRTVPAATYYFYNVGIDYRSKQRSYIQGVATPYDVQSRCIGSQLYTLDAATSTHWLAATDSSHCSDGFTNGWTNDGMNTGGLNASQSNVFIQHILASHVVTVNSLSLIVGSYPANKLYLKFDVNITPRLQSPKTYVGMGAFLDAFKATGLNPLTHPYSHFGGASDGAHMVYYVDPDTMLPYYSISDETSSFDTNGAPITLTTWNHRYVEYIFPASVPNVNLNDHNQETTQPLPE